MTTFAAQEEGILRPAPMPNRPKIVIVAGVLLLAHLLVLLLLRGHSFVSLISNLLQVAFAGLAALSCGLAARRCKGFERAFWALMSLSLLLWTLAQTMATYYDSILHQPLLSPWPSDIIFFVFVAPMAVAVFLSATGQTGHPDWQRRLDYFQVSILILLTYLYFYYTLYDVSLWFKAGPSMARFIWGASVIRAFILVVVFLGRGAFARYRPARQLFLGMGAFLLAYSAVDSFYLYGESAWNLQSGGWWDFGYSLCFCVAIAFPAFYLQRPAPAELAPPSERGLLVFQSLPILFPLLILLVASQFPRDHIGLAWIAVVASFLISFARLAVTEHNQRVAAQAQAAAETKFRLLFSSNPQAIFVWDVLTKKILEVNQTMADRYGYSREELLGMEVLQLRHPPDEAGLLRDAANSRAVQGERGCHRAKDGSLIQVEIFAQSLDFGGRKARLVVAQDIAERTKAEDRFRSLVQNASDIITILDVDGVIRYQSPSVEARLGYRPEAMTGKNVFDYVHPDDRERTRTIFSQAMHASAQTVAAPELRFRHADGSWAYLDVVGNNLLQDPNIQGIVVNSRDVTERVRSQQALRVQQEFLRQVMDLDPNLIFVKDWNGRFTLANQALADLYRSTKEALIGKTDADFNPNAVEVSYYQRSDQQVIGSQKELLVPEDPVTDPRSGEVRWFQTRKVPIVSPDGSTKLVLGVSTDITDRKRAEAIVLDWKNRYEAAVLASGQIIYDWQPAPDVLTLGGNLEKILGYTLVESNTHGWWQTIVHPQDIQRYLAEVERVLAAKQPFHMEYRVRRKDGAYITVRDDGYLVLDAAGAIVRMVGFVADITERQMLEAQLRQSQKMEAVGQLAGGIAHDFNNLLGIIIGFTELALGELRTADPLYRTVEEIKKAGQRAASLTRQLLAFSRKQVLEPKVLDLNLVLTDLGKMLHRVIGEDIELTILPAPKLGAILADPGQIEQILVNLALNARDAMPQGGKITVATSDVALDAETRACIFEPFFTTKPQGKGTGLGLSMVYGIIKQSGGHISVYSEPGQGSTFKLYFPRSQQPLASAPSPAAKTHADGTETILLVEDEDGVRRLAREYLEKRGYCVLESQNPREALQRSKSHAGPIHLILTDVIMPGMSGQELTEQLRATRPEAKILFMSGYTGDAVLQHGIVKLGAAFLQKPFNLSDLGQKVREVLDHQVPAT